MPITSARSVLRAAALPLLFTLQATACGPRLAGPSGPGYGGGQVITEQEIARGPARTAWELLEGRIPQLRFSGDVGGASTSVRGRGAEARPPVVVLNGVVTRGVEHLRTIPAREIRSIRVLSGIEGSQRYGAFGSNGAIVIETHQA